MTQTMTIRLPDDVHERLRKESFEWKRSMNGIIAEALEWWWRSAPDYSDQEIALAQLGHQPGCAFREQGRGVTCTCHVEEATP